MGLCGLLRPPALEAGKRCFNVLEAEPQAGFWPVSKLPRAELGSVLVDEGAIDGEEDSRRRRQ